jgi:putative hydrolase of the HAD superfamily
VLAFEIGVKKPDLAAYQILLNRLNVLPEEILFIDNKEENVKAAKTLNIDGIVFFNAKQLIEELKKEISFYKFIKIKISLISI